MKKIKLYTMSLLMVLPLAIVASLDIFSNGFHLQPIGDLLKAGNFVTILCCFFIVFAFCSHCEFYNKSKNAFDGLPVTISSIENINAEFISLFMTLLSVLAFDLTTIRGAVLFVLVLFLLGWLFIKTDLFYSNPCFALLGYHIYRVSSKEKAIQDNSIVICRDKLSINDRINKIKLADHVFFCKKA